MAIYNSPVAVLFFAPQWGMEKWLRRRDCFQCVTTDLSEPGVDFHADITKLPVTNGSYDLILCSHVLEHVNADAKAIGEMFRALRPGGCALIQVPWNSDLKITDEDATIVGPRERKARFGQFDHVRMYGRDIVERLRSPGFEVRAIYLVRGLDPYESRRLGLWDDVIFVCHKPGSPTTSFGAEGLHCPA